VLALVRAALAGTGRFKPTLAVVEPGVGVRVSNGVGRIGPPSTRGAPQLNRQEDIGADEMGLGRGRTWGLGFTGGSTIVERRDVGLVKAMFVGRLAGGARQRQSGLLRGKASDDDDHLLVLSKHRNLLLQYQDQDA
jgi:hypothetical protein